MGLYGDPLSKDPKIVILDYDRKHYHRLGRTRFSSVTGINFIIRHQVSEPPAQAFNIYPVIWKDPGKGETLGLYQILPS